MQKGYCCVWEHLDDDPKKELTIVKSKKPVLQQHEANTKIKNDFRVHKDEKGYWQRRKSEEGVREAEREIFSALETKWNAPA